MKLIKWKKENHWINNLKLRVILLAVSLTKVLTFSGCGLVDYRAKLPNGYLLARSNARSIIILNEKAGDIAIGSKVSKLNVKGDIVFGEVKALPSKSLAPPEHIGIPGYFILNTKTNSIQSGLERQEWLERLKQAGVTEEPSLRTSSSFRKEPAVVTIIKVMLRLY